MSETREVPADSIVVITDCDFGAGEIEQEILADHGLAITVAHARTPAEVIAASQGAVGLLVQYAPVTAAVLSALPTVQAVVRYGVGLDTIDLTAADQRGVHVRGVTDYCTDEVADHCLALILCCLRSIASADAAIKRGQWPMPVELPRLTRMRGTTVGLLGFGRTARALSSRLIACGAVVHAYDPHVAEDEIAAIGVRPSLFEDVVHCDVVSLHIPAEAGSPPVVDASFIARMRPAAILINTARGSLIDETELCSALDAGQVAWAGVDVVRNEGPSRSVLARHPRVTATPHVAYYSPTSLRQLRRQAAEQMVDLLDRAAASSANVPTRVAATPR